LLGTKLDTTYSSIFLADSLIIIGGSSPLNNRPNM
jgi:hypothetical protein